MRRLEDAQPISDKSNISGYVTAIADSARILCEQSGKTLSIQNNISDIPIGIDYTFVSQVNNNLISNAIRYATSKVSPPNKKNGALVGSINTPRRKFNFPPNPFSSLEEFFYAMVEYDRNAAHQKQLLFTECHSGVKIIF